MDRRGLGRNLLSNISGSPGNGGREKSRKVERGRKKMRRNNKKEVENEGTGIGKDQASERASERRKEREEARDGEAVGGGGGIGSAFPGAKVARRPNAIPISARTSREPTTAPVSPPLTPPRRPQERENSPHRIGSMDERKRKKERKKEKKEERKKGKERKGRKERRGETVAEKGVGRESEQGYPPCKGGVAARMGRYVCRGRTAATPPPPSWNRCRSSGRKELLRSSGAPGVHPVHPLLCVCARLHARIPPPTLLSRTTPRLTHVSSVREGTYVDSACISSSSSFSSSFFTRFRSVC